ncbi:MAG: HK97 gp10 family phage protein [Tepidisphaeraceae bacterium]
MAKVRGLDRLLKKLGRLEKTAAKRVVRKAIRAGTTIVGKAIKAETPVDQGKLKKAQTTRVTSRRNRATGVAGADQDKLNADAEGGKRPSNIDWLVDQGHVAPDGTVIPPSGYHRRAEDKAMPAAVAAMEKKLAEEIEREASK